MTAATASTTRSRRARRSDSEAVTPARRRRFTRARRARRTLADSHATAEPFAPSRRGCCDGRSDGAARTSVPHHHEAELVATLARETCYQLDWADGHPQDHVLAEWWGEMA